MYVFSGFKTSRDVEIISELFRLILWKKKTDSAKLTAKPPALKFLPPTDEALELNIYRGHHQAILWDKCVLGGKLPSIDPELVSIYFALK